MNIVRFEKVPFREREIGKDNYPELPENIREAHTEKLLIKYKDLLDEMKMKGFGLCALYDENGVILGEILTGQWDCDFSTRFSLVK